MPAGRRLQGGDNGAMPDHHPHLVLIAALDRHLAIGRGGALLWHDSQDQQHFRRATMGCPVVMGRKTWDSLPPRFRPLPGRRNLVLTRNPAWQAAGAEPVDSLDAALARTADADKVFVIGGAELYALALPRADELLLTEIDRAFEGADAYFPRWDRAAWREIGRQTQHGADGTRFAFVTYRRMAG